MIAGWLTAGVFEAGRGFAPTGEGTPQGGVISPLLLNVALHGLEEAAGTAYRAGRPGWTRAGTPVVTRYADDFTVCCHSRRQAGQIREKLTGWLAGRGLSLNEEKTRIVPLSDGFDFLGWNFRRYPDGKLLIRPSRASVTRHRVRLAEETRRMRGSSAGRLIRALNPVIRGWTAYHRGQVSSEIFSSLSDYTWKLTYKWGRRSHPGKGARWVTGKYYGAFHPGREDKWVFGDRDTGAYLLKHSWTGIRRHIMVQGRSSPDDPDLAGYWEARWNKTGLGIGAGLLTQQDYTCPYCRDPLMDVRHIPSSAAEWQEWWYGVTRQHIPRAPSAPGQSQPANATGPVLIHASCNRARKAAQRKTPGIDPALSSVPA